MMVKVVITTFAFRMKLFKVLVSERKSQIEGSQN